MRARREVLAGVGATGLAAVAGCLGGRGVDSGSAREYDWSTGGADDRRSRAIPDGVAPREEATVDETFEFEAHPVTAAPAVADSAIVITTGRDVVAFDAETFERRWSVDPENRGVSYGGTATIADGTVYVAGDETFRAIDLKSGAQRWKFGFEYPFIDHSPTYRARSETVYAAAGEYVRAFDAESGDAVWERRLFGIVGGSLAFNYAPSINLIVPTQGGELYALDSDGRVRWRRQLPKEITTTPTLLGSDDRRGGRRIVVGCLDGHVYCFDTNGNREWRASAGPFADGPIAIGHGMVFIRSGSTLYAINADNGDHEWRVNIGSDHRNPPILVGDTVYIGGDRLRAIAIGGGTGVRQYRFGETRFEHAVDGRVSFVSAAHGSLFVVVHKDEGSAFELQRLS
ncbi:PQQ-binding-like beta-propeller repeat protein [Natrinema caseinilyticum]|uniref:PQQ-binding-like beta-propeller repeat protein n=1 Tax=Natrinema caseinilyticum TaxID=2961570 RepID=UPI0020C20FDB|nr:PQQ-binding-like beta-propeller repeat protein [Natrinema caseinilyticum]